MSKEEAEQFNPPPHSYFIW